MKIAYLHQYFRLPTDGGSSRTYEMARRLVRRGHEVHVVTTDWRAKSAGQSWRVSEHAGITVHEIDIPYHNTMGFGERIKRFAQFAVRSCSRARSLRADAIFATSTPLTIAIPAIYAKLGRRVPLVFEVRDLWPEVPIALGALKNPVMRAAAIALERLTYACSDFVVALSPGMKDGVVRTGFPADRVAVIPNASDNAMFDAVDEAEVTDLRRSLSWLQDRPLVLYCGTIGLANDVSYLARVAAAAAELDPKVQFLVVGEGNDESTVRETARALGVLEKNFHMIPAIPKKQVPAYFKAATITAATFAPEPSLRANSANKVFDAFAAAKPVVINYSGWQKELLDESGAGLVVNYADPRAAAREICALSHDAERLERMSRASKRLGTDLFDRDRLAEMLAEVLETAERGRRETAVGLPSGVTVLLSGR